MGSTLFSQARESLAIERPLPAVGKRQDGVGMCCFSNNKAAEEAMSRKVSEASDGETVAVSAGALNFVKGKLDATAIDGSGKILLEKVRGHKNVFLLISYPGRNVLPHTFLTMTYTFDYVRSRKARRTRVQA